MSIVVDVNTPLSPVKQTRLQTFKQRARNFFNNGPLVFCCFCGTVMFAFVLGLLIANEIEFSK